MSWNKDMWDGYYAVPSDPTLELVRIARDTFSIHGMTECLNALNAGDISLDDLRDVAVRSTFNGLPRNHKAVQEPIFAELQEIALMILFGSDIPRQQNWIDMKYDPGDGSAEIQRLGHAHPQAVVDNAINAV